LRFLNPKLVKNKVGSKHLFAWQEFAADLLEELLEKQIDQVADQPRVFKAPDQSMTIALTDMCRTMVIRHLQADGTDVTAFPHTVEFLGEYIPGCVDDCDPLVSFSPLVV